MKKTIGQAAWGLALLPLTIIGCGFGGYSNYNPNYKPPPPSPSLSITPTVISVTPGAKTTFTPTIANSKNKVVKWIVTEGASGGTITASGQYTAPATIGIYHVVATLQGDPIPATATIAVATSVPRYTITNVGSVKANSNLPFPQPLVDESTMTAINNMGQIVGTSQHALLWSGGASKDLGTLGGTNSEATALNDNGQVVGASLTADTVGTGPDNSPFNIPGVFHAFLYSNGAMQDLGTLPLYNQSFATAVNASGQVVGFAGDGFVSQRSFLYRDGTMTDLGTLPGGQYSAATGINAAGQVVGFSSTNGVRHAFLYSNGTMQDLGVPSGYSQSEAFAINNQGQVAGILIGATGKHLFLYANGAMQDLGVLGNVSSNADIDAVVRMNNRGQIVAYLVGSIGSFTITGNGGSFVYSGGVLQALIGLAPVGSSFAPATVSGINDAGQITGTTSSNGVDQSIYLMSPQ